MSESELINLPVLKPTISKGVIPNLAIPKPKALKPGSRIAIISPSSGIAPLFPGIYELGLRNLRELIGLEVIEMPTSRMATDELYKNPKLRAEDINNAFKDDSIDGIITTIGGYESIRILKHLDVDMIMRNPKFIMGFSDATTFLTYLNCQGMVTFYGPSVMAGLAQLKSLSRQCVEHIKDILFSEAYPYRYAPYEEWTNGYKDWNNKDTLGECTEFFNNEKGWTFLQGSNVAKGRLWGGCIEVLEFMKSTVYWPGKDFWEDRILFFETSEEKPTPRQVGYMLRNYGIQGVLNKVKGIIFGRPKDYSEMEKDELNKVILQIVRDEFDVPDLPVVVNMDFGHTDPKLILPMGCSMMLDPERNEITLLERPFE